MEHPTDFMGADPARLCETLEALRDDIRLLAGGVQPDAERLERAPVIRNWGFVRRQTLALVGAAYGHPVIAEGHHAVTSEIFAMDRGRRWARTFSRYYVLGPAGKFGMPQ